MRLRCSCCARWSGRSGCGAAGSARPARPDAADADASPCARPAGAAAPAAPARRRRPSSADRHPERLARRVRRDPRRRLGGRRRPASQRSRPTSAEARSPRPSFTPPRARRRSSSARSWPARRGARPAPGRAACAHGDAAARSTAAADHAAPAVGRPRHARRAAARPGRSQGEPAADALRAALEPLVKVDDAAERRSAAARSMRRCCRSRRGPKPAQRVAWIYYVARPRRRRAPGRRHWRAGASGEWARAGGVGFGPGVVADERLQRRVARVPRGRRDSRREREFSAARLLLGGARRAGLPPPAAVAPLLHAAARSPESFYGLLARETLGMDNAPARPPRRATSSRGRSAAQRPPRGRAGRRSASARWPRRCCATRRKIGSPSDHHGADRGRRAARPWPARNSGSPTTASPGRGVDAADRYPTPRWTPDSGWRVDPALAYRPHHPGIELPRRGGQPGRRGRADAGPPRHRRRHGARARPALTRAPRSSDPSYQPRLWPELHRADAPLAGDRAASCPRSSPPTMPGRCRSSAGPASRPRRSAAVDREHPLLGNALLRARGAAQHVGLSRGCQGRAPTPHACTLAGFRPQHPNWPRPSRSLERGGAMYIGLAVDLLIISVVLINRS